MLHRGGYNSSENSSGYSVPGSDNAYRVALSSDALQEIPEQRLIDNWRGNNDYPDFHNRCAVRQYYYPPAADSGPRSPGSDMSSAVASYPPWQGSSPPSLMHSSGSRRTSSVGTSAGSLALNQVQQFLPRDDDSIAEVPASNWTCPYEFLGCAKSFDCLEVWDCHCQTHFYGRGGSVYLPRFVDCPFACTWSFLGSTGPEAWQQRRSHISFSHPTGGQPSGRPPIKELIQHLWQNGIIDPTQVQELQMYGQLRPTAAPVLQSERSAHGRRQDRGSRGYQFQRR